MGLFYFIESGMTIFHNYLASLMKKGCLCVLLLLLLLSGKAQSSCNTVPFRPVNNIRNPSFEQGDTLYCISQFFTTPGSPRLETYIPYWMNATGRHDQISYVGKCNNYDTSKTSKILETPLPIPDGNGALSLFDFSAISGFQKTYISNCLASPLQKNYLYQLNISLGFGKRDSTLIYPNIAGVLREATSPSPERITLFGSDDCSIVPYFDSNVTYNRGCLTQLGINGWKELGTCSIAGDSGTWAKGTITFTAPFDVKVIAIGPACDSKPPSGVYIYIWQGEYVYYIDNLQLYQSIVSKPTIAMVDGTNCDGPNAFATLQVNNAAQYQGAQFQWYKNNNVIAATGTSITINKFNYGPGWFQCNIYNDSICMRSDSLYVDWVAGPSLTSLGMADTTACSGDTVVLNVTTPSASYKWQDSTTVPVKNVTESGAYKVTVSNACASATLSKNITFKACPSTFYVPSAFTPNNDGLNDVFKAHLKGVVKQFDLSVFNRFGQRVFYTTDINKGWDGNINSSPQGQGTYVWMLHYIDGNDQSHTEKGTLVLIR